MRRVYDGSGGLHNDVCKCCIGSFFYGRSVGRYSVFLYRPLPLQSQLYRSAEWSVEDDPWVK